jgi:hypothetical protein
VNSSDVAPVPRDDQGGVSHLERVEAVFTNPDLYSVGEGLVPRDPTKGGRPRQFPEYFVFAFADLADIYTSARAAWTALKGPLLWERIRAIVRQQCPDDPSKWLPDQPPSRTWYVKARNRITDFGTTLEELGDRFNTAAVETAEALGLLDPTGAGTPTHPDPSRMIHHDGKALRPLYNGRPGDTRDVKVTDPRTGEVRIEQRPVPVDPDAKLHVSGDGSQVHGNKFWLAMVRGLDPHTRVILAVDQVPGVRDELNSEADIAVANLLELAPLAPGALGAICDTVLRGVHIDRLVRATGWIVVNPVTAQRVDPKTGERTEKTGYVRTVVFEYPDGSTEMVDIWFSGGLLCRVVYADDGTRVLVPLRRVGNPIRKNTNRTFRTYVEYEVPCPRGRDPQVIREPTFSQEDDPFNVPENIRQIPPGDPDYERLMGRRSDAESANRGIDDQLYLRRARSLGARRQLFDLFAHAFVENSVARKRHRSGAGPPAELAA